jgi:putative transposase
LGGEAVDADGHRVVLVVMATITEGRTDTLADDLRMALLELLRTAEVEREVDVLRERVRVIAQALMELEVSQHVGAEKHQRTPARTGYRDRPGETRVGTIAQRVPRVHNGSFFPSLWEPRRRAERARVAVVQKASVQEVSTRRVDDLVRALGMEGINKSPVSRLCQELDAAVARCRTRRLEGPSPLVWLDAPSVKVRDQGRVVSTAVVLAIGVRATGERTQRVPGSGWRWAPVRTGPSGPSFCEGWWRGGSRGCSW